MGIYFDLFKDQWEKFQKEEYDDNVFSESEQENIMNADCVKDGSPEVQREILGHAVELIAIAYHEYNQGNDENAIDILAIVQALGEAIECQILLDLVKMAMEAMSK